MPLNNFSSPARTTVALLGLLMLGGCGVGINYSLRGATTTAETIAIAEFYNNADLGPANMAQTLSNELKNYFVQNSNLRVVPEDAELFLEGEITNYTLTPIAPVTTGEQGRRDITRASSTRLTITVRATYINTLDENMSFKAKSFSFYKDFPNDINVSDVEEQYVREIFQRIINDIFNASVANW